MNGFEIEINPLFYLALTLYGIQHPENILNPALDIKIHHPVQRNVAISVLSMQNYMIAI